MIKQTIIADASPLIAFGRIKGFEILTRTLGKIILPEAVAQECLIDISLPGALEIKNAINTKVIEVHANPNDKAAPLLATILGKGESTAIALALALHAGLLIDEKLGRKVAKKLNLKIIGTAGVLLLAKRQGIIEKINPVIQQLQDASYYLSEALISEIRRIANELI